MHVSEHSLFLGISRLLWAFSILPALDAAPGREEALPDAEALTQGFVAMPQPFRARIRTRSEKRARVVRGEWERVEEEELDKRTRQWRRMPEGVGLSGLGKVGG